MKLKKKMSFIFSWFKLKFPNPISIFLLNQFEPRKYFKILCNFQFKKKNQIYKQLFLITLNIICPMWVSPCLGFIFRNLFSAIHTFIK